MLNVDMNDEEVRTAAYDLLGAVCTYLGYEKNFIVAPKGQSYAIWNSLLLTRILLQPVSFLVIQVSSLSNSASASQSLLHSSLSILFQKLLLR